MPTAQPVAAGTPVAAAREHAETLACAPNLYATDYQSIPMERTDTMVRRLMALGLTTNDAKASLKVLTQRAAMEKLGDADQLIVVRKVDPCNVVSADVLSMTLAQVGIDAVTVVRDDDGKFDLLDATSRYNFPMRVSGAIDGSDLESGLISRGVPAPVAEQVAESFATDPSIPEGMVYGLKFDVVYQVEMSTGGAPLGAKLTMASLAIDGREHRAYYYKPGRGAAQVVDETGQSLTTPVQFAHPLPQGTLTSGFGWRRHPVLHKRKFHMGVDFSAPRGTPVVAAADGVVTIANAKGGNYGKYIKISHGDRTETLYAHLNGFASIVRQGATVRQGQVIGYVGRSGLASGNHLYFEVYLDGRQVDPFGLAPELMAGQDQMAPPANRDELVRYIAECDVLRTQTTPTASPRDVSLASQ